MSKKKLWAAGVCAGMVVLQSSAVFAAEDLQEKKIVESGKICDLSTIESYAESEPVGFIELVRDTYLSGARAVTGKEAIYNGMLAGAESIDVSSYDIPITEIDALYDELMHEHAELFYVQGLGYSYYESTNTIAVIEPVYSMTGDDLEVAKEVFDTEMNYILEQVEDDWSDLEKALFLHDYIASHFEYDVRVYEEATMDDVVYDSYGFFVQGTGVCQAYTLTYNYLLKQVGINGSFATSETMNHIWNMIQIDGEWYHVDVTWDDPVQDTLGKANHNNFLLSDVKISTPEYEGQDVHKNWAADYKATSTKYDNSFWRSSNAPFVWEDGQWYYMSETGFAMCDVNARTAGEDIYTISDRWVANGNQFWVGIFSGLGEYNGVIYFNGPTNIYGYDVATEELSIVHTVSVTGQTRVYGLLLDENEILFGTSTSPSSSKNKIVATGAYELPLAPEVPDIVLDADVDFGYEVDETETAISCKGEAITPENLRLIFGDSAVVYNGTTAVADGEAVGTGYEVQVGNDSYTVVVKGDATGDAAINVQDMEAIQKHILQFSQLEGVYCEAGMLTENAGTLSVKDMEEIQKYILQLTEW